MVRSRLCVYLLLPTVLMAVLAGDARARSPSAAIPRTPEAEALQRRDATLPPPFSEAIPGIVLASYESNIWPSEIGRGRLVHAALPIDPQVDRPIDPPLKARQAQGSRALTPEQVAAAEDLAERALHDPARVKDAYRQIAILLMNDFDGGDLDLQSPSLILRQWSLLEAWVAQQSPPPLTQLSTAAAPYAPLIARLDPSLEVHTLDLGADATLLAIQQRGLGYVAIVQKGVSAPVWRVDRIPDKSPAAASLSCWRAEAGMFPCAPWRVGLLSADAQGRRRFYIEAEHAQPAGATVSHQLSVWRWDGGVATALYVTSYAVVREAQAEGVRIAGDVITIERKDHFRTLLACESCDGRQLAQRLQLTPADQVQALETVSLTPELDLIDALLSRIRAGQPAVDLAEPAVTGLIKSWWGEAQQLGVLMSEPQTVTTVDGQRTLCFRADVLPGVALPPMLFTFAGLGAGLRAIAAQEGDAGARICPAPGE